jgi:hypothetical protein
MPRTSQSASGALSAIPIMATARETIKQAGYILATSDLHAEISLADRNRSIHTGHRWLQRHSADYRTTSDTDRHPVLQ